MICITLHNQVLYSLYTQAKEVKKVTNEKTNKKEGEITRGKWGSKNDVKGHRQIPNKCCLFVTQVKATTNQHSMSHETYITIMTEVHAYRVCMLLLPEREKYGRWAATAAAEFE